LKGIKIAFIPDCQVKDGIPLEHLTWAGKYIADKQPDIIVQAGDFADMPSLSSYDKGRKSFEGRRYRKDVDAVKRGMDILLKPILRKAKYKPRRILTLGNHEDRISRAIEDDAKLEGTIGLQDLGYEAAGWEVFPYLEAIKAGGINFAHFFPSGVMGRPCISARKILATYHESCVAGHQQGLDFAGPVFKADGDRITAIIAGSFYQHEESFLNPTGNKRHWRGLIMLHEVYHGNFDPMFVSMAYLKGRFAK
jgi:hypothetical protein